MTCLNASKREDTTKFIPNSVVILEAGVSLIVPTKVVKELLFTLNHELGCWCVSPLVLLGCVVHSKIFFSVWCQPNKLVLVFSLDSELIFFVLMRVSSLLQSLSSVFRWIIIILLLSWSASLLLLLANIFLFHGLFQIAVVTVRLKLPITWKSMMGWIRFTICFWVIFFLTFFTFTTVTFFFIRISLLLLMSPYLLLVLLIWMRAVLLLLLPRFINGFFFITGAFFIIFVVLTSSILIFLNLIVPSEISEVFAANILTFLLLSIFRTSPICSNILVIFFVTTGLFFLHHRHLALLLLYNFWSFIKFRLIERTIIVFKRTHFVKSTTFAFPASFVFLFLETRIILVSIWKNTLVLWIIWNIGVCSFVAKIWLSQLRFSYWLVPFIFSAIILYETVILFTWLIAK